MKRLLFAKSLLRLGELTFGAGLVSFWFTPATVEVKIALGTLVVILYFTAIIFIPTRSIGDTAKNG